MTVEQADSDWAELDQNGQAIYNERLKALLEPAQTGKSVAIHIGNGDYEVDVRWAFAIRRLRERHPEGFIFSRFIGPPTNEEHNLGLKLSAGKAQ